MCGRRQWSRSGLKQSHVPSSAGCWSGVRTAAQQLRRAQRRRVLLLLRRRRRRRRRLLRAAALRRLAPLQLLLHPFHLRRTRAARVKTDLAGERAHHACSHRRHMLQRPPERAMEKKAFLNPTTRPSCAVHGDASHAHRMRGDATRSSSRRRCGQQRRRRRTSASSSWQRVTEYDAPCERAFCSSVVSDSSIVCISACCAPPRPARRASASWARLVGRETPAWHPSDTFWGLESRCCTQRPLLLSTALHVSPSYHPSSRTLQRRSNNNAFLRERNGPINPPGRGGEGERGAGWYQVGAVVAHVAKLALERGDLQLVLFQVRVEAGNIALARHLQLDHL